ncbi:MAG: ATP synthase F1 subunit delta [bacterium]
MLSIAARYAFSLFNKAKEKNKVEQVMNELQKFTEIIQKNKDLERLWNSLSIPYTIKESILLKRISFSEITTNFLKLILLKKRQKLLPKIFYYYKLVYNYQNKILEVDIKTAFEINQDQLQKIIQLLENNLKLKVKLKNISIDREIIGGIIVISDDLIIDLSVKKDLDKALRKIEETINNKMDELKIV